MGTQSLNQQQGKLHGTQLGSLHICDSFVWLGLFEGLPGMGAGISLVLWVALGNNFIMLDCLAEPEHSGRCLILWLDRC